MSSLVWRHMSKCAKVWERLFNCDVVDKNRESVHVFLFFLHLPGHDYCQLDELILVCRSAKNMFIALQW